MYEAELHLVTFKQINLLLVSEVNLHEEFPNRSCWITAFVDQQ